MARVLSAIVLAALVLGVVIFLPPIYTLVLAVLTAALAFAEYAELAAALGAHVPRVIGAAAVTATCVAVGSTVLPLDAVLLSIFVSVGVFAVALGQPGPAVLRDTAATVLPVFYIGMPIGSLAAIRLFTGAEGTLLLIVTMIVSDSAQYYTGRMFGRRPLAPLISPNKTVEGAIGGLILGTAMMALGGLHTFPEAPRVMLVLASATVVAVGMIGDLFESLLKRSAGVKDSSTLIPGHGGVLDRIDSWLFAGPLYYVFARYLQAS
jgi:phosphatidate cytidylyltransferase